MSGSHPRPWVDLDTEVRRRVTAAGQRYTANRQALVRILSTAERPSATAEVVSRGDDIPQSLEYRNLSVLESAGAVQRVAAGDDFPRYKLAEDHAGHHHHLTFTDCG